MAVPFRITSANVFRSMAMLTAFRTRRSEKGPLACQHSITLVGGQAAEKDVEPLVALERLDLIDGNIPGNVDLAGP